MKKIIFAIILLLPVVFAAPPDSDIAYGGNITELAIGFTQITPNWQGYAGIMTYGTGPTAPTAVNATGSNVSGQGFHLQIPCNNPTAITGFILFSNSSSIPAGLVPGNLSKLDALISGDDSGTNTFSQLSAFNFPSAGIVNNVPTAYTYVNQKPQAVNFREGYLHDAAGNLVFATEINFVPKPGYNLSSFSYQIMAAAPNYSTVPYYIFTDLNAVCPKPAPGVGGGSAGFCREQWQCTEWGPCINGLQARDCRQTVYCEYYSGRYFPPTERACGEKKEAADEIQQDLPGYNVTIDEFPLQDILDNITLLLPGKTGADSLNPQIFEVEISNGNQISLENLQLSLSFPEISTKYTQIHQFRRIFWGYDGLHGWSVRERMKKSYPWTIKSGQFRISPKSSVKHAVEVIPPALMPQEINAVLALSLGAFEITSKEFPVQIEVNSFDMGYSFNQQTKSFALFFIIDNRHRPVMKNTFIEFSLNKGKSTRIAELFGPYDFPAGEITILAQEYNLGITGEYVMKAVLHNSKDKSEVERKCIISG